ncbi:MAG: hypothetical protein ACYTG1_13585 [Planctomycetota bacterium]
MFRTGMAVLAMVVVCGLLNGCGESESDLADKYPDVPTSGPKPTDQQPITVPGTKLDDAKSMGSGGGGG